MKLCVFVKNVSEYSHKSIVLSKECFRIYHKAVGFHKECFKIYLTNLLSSVTNVSYEAVSLCDKYSAAVSGKGCLKIAHEALMSVKKVAEFVSPSCGSQAKMSQNLSQWAVVV